MLVLQIISIFSSESTEPILQILEYINRVVLGFWRASLGKVLGAEMKDQGYYADSHEIYAPATTECLSVTHRDSRIILAVDI